MPELIAVLEVSVECITEGSHADLLLVYDEVHQSGQRVGGIGCAYHHPAGSDVVAGAPARDVCPLLDAAVHDRRDVRAGHGVPMNLFLNRSRDHSVFHEESQLLEEGFVELFECAEALGIAGVQSHLCASQPAAAIVQRPFDGRRHVEGAGIGPFTDFAVMGHNAPEEAPVSGFLGWKAGIHHHLHADQVIVKGGKTSAESGQPASGAQESLRRRWVNPNAQRGLGQPHIFRRLEAHIRQLIDGVATVFLPASDGEVLERVVAAVVFGAIRRQKPQPL